MAIRLLVASLLFSSVSFGDLKYRMHTTGRFTQDRIVYVHGDRIRTEFPETGRVNIRQCDLGQIVLLDPQAKTYRIQPIEARPQSEDEDSAPPAGSSSCRMKLRKQIEETGESEKLLGFDAQHIRVFVYMDPVPDSCPQNARLASTLVQLRDGWYIQVPSLPECPAVIQNTIGRNRSFDVPDRYVRTDGTLTADLVPAKVQVKRRRGQQLERTFTAEASEVSTEALDPALFAIPVGYREVQQIHSAPCSGSPEPVDHLADGSPVYRAGCGVTPPRPLERPEPEYSEQARKKKISGLVVLSVIVDQAGEVRDAKVERSLEKSLDERALAAVHRWKFQPATKDGQAVAVKVDIEMNFRIR